MTLLIVLVLAAILVVIGISMIKKAAKNQVADSTPNIPVNQVNTTSVTPPNSNPGSIPDQAGAKGHGDSALSSGKQG